MGTLLNIEIECVTDTQCSPFFFTAATIAQDIEEKMTTYRPSEVTRLRDKAGLPDFMQPVSHDTYVVIAAALGVAKASDGYFDPTLGTHGNYQEIDMKSGRVGIRQHGMLVDLGGIAKGYALDKIGAAFTGNNWTLNFGGQISTHRMAREVTLPDPRDDKLPFLVCNFSEGSLSTSAQNQRPGHLINPKTHLPGAHNIASVVWHLSAMQADAWSTALFFADARHFREWTRKHNLVAYQMTASGEIVQSMAALRQKMCSVTTSARLPAP